MATKDQYEFFKYMYDEEERTYDQREGRARLYLTIISLFLAGLLLKAQEVKASAAAIGVPWWSFLLVAVALAVALLLFVLAMSIRTYEGAANLEDIFNGFGKKPSADDAFFDARLADFTVATTRNSLVNNKAATLLQYAGHGLALAMLFLLLGLLLTLKP